MIENISTLTFKTIDDTLATWDGYQQSRLEFDAEKTELEGIRSSGTLETQQSEVCFFLNSIFKEIVSIVDHLRFLITKARLIACQKKFEDSKRMVQAKLKLLDENKVIFGLDSHSHRRLR